MNFALHFIIYTCLKCNIVSDLILFVHTVSVTSEKKRGMGIFLPFPENKEDKREQRAGLNIPSFVFLFLFILKAPNSECN